jgi:hypothetical protein
MNNSFDELQKIMKENEELQKKLFTFAELYSNTVMENERLKNELILARRNIAWMKNRLHL